MKPQDDKHVFASKFQDFGAVPSDAVWKGIEATLPDEKRKKPVLLWWWTSGIAASFIIGLVLFTSNGGNSSVKNTRTVSEPRNFSADKSSISTHKQVTVSSGNNEDLSLQVNRNGRKPTSQQESNPESNQTAFNEEHSAEGNQVNENNTVAEVPRENWGSLGWKRFDFLPNQLEIGKRDFSTDRNDSRWWIGITMEQSNRFAMKNVESQPPPTSINSSADNYNMTDPYHWNRTQTVQLTGGFDWKRNWSFGTGLEYSSWNKLEGNEGSVIPVDGYSIGIPVFATFHFYSNQYFRLGAQLDIRQRYLFNRTLTSVSSPTYNPGEGLSEQDDLKGFQTQVGIGLNAEVPFCKRFKWNTTFEYQHSGYRSTELETVVNGSWLGLKTGILFTF